MSNTALVTGGFGFLGRAVARKLKEQGFRVVGIGHGRWTSEEALVHGFDLWEESDVSLAGLTALNEHYELVVHCAGNGSVNYSLTNPLQDFKMTLQSTAELLEYLRSTESNARLIYPSSAAVYGSVADQPLFETDRPNPVSPYGFHKKITEDLLEFNSKYFGMKVAIVRFFSIYGPGLAKQLLWDAAGKLSSGEPEVSFWGTGEETRDWIHIDDAAALVIGLSKSTLPFALVNGATGNRITVRAVLQMLKQVLDVKAEISFNGEVRPGDPRFYHADMSRARQLGFQPTVSLSDGISQYAQWFKKETWSK